MSLSQTVIAKRGYLANITVLPPLIYPFQYNPTRLTDSKQVTWGRRFPIPPAPKKGGLLGAVAAATGIGSPETMARKFSKADLHRFESEGDRTLSFQLVLDGRDQRPGEPKRRRNDAGDILADLAILRSFVYPAFDLSKLLGSALGGGDDSKQFIEQWFNEPPSALLILGDLAVEGFVSSLQINETQFNADLNPVRAEVDITLIEKIDSLSFIVGSVKRIGRASLNSAYEDIGDIGKSLL